MSDLNLLVNQLHTQISPQQIEEQKIEENYWYLKAKKGIQKMFQQSGNQVTNPQNSSSTFKALNKEEQYKNQLCDRKSSEIKRFILRNINSSFFGLNELKGLSLTQWNNLNTLVLNSCPYAKDCLTTLCEAKWNNLQRISLQNTQLSQNYVKNLKQFVEKWQKLNQLNLNDNNIEFKTQSSSILQNISKKLQIFYLNNNQIDDQRFQSIIWTKNMEMLQWQNLKLLSLKNNKIGSKGIRYLMRNSTMHRSLQKLILSNNKICNMGAYNLSKIYFPKLQELYLDGCGMNDDGILIMQTMRLRSIICLDFDKNNINQLSKINLMGKMELRRQTIANTMLQLRCIFRCKYKLYL